MEFGYDQVAQYFSPFPVNPMREVYNHREFERVGFSKSVLDDAGIPNYIRNEHSNNLITGLPSPLFTPALFVVNDDDYAEAMQILDAIHHPPNSQAADWSCPKCGELVSGNFDSCWKCGFMRVSPSGDSTEP